MTQASAELYPLDPEQGHADIPSPRSRPTMDTVRMGAGVDYASRAAYRFDDLLRGEGRHVGHVLHGGLQSAGRDVRA